MAGVLQVDIVTPERSAFSGKASELVFPAWDGEMGVYPDHDALLAAVRSGSCVVVTTGAVHRFVVGRGYADVGSGWVTLLTDSCEAIADIDRERARKDLAEAEASMASLDSASEAWRQAQIAAEHARARVEA